MRNLIAKCLAVLILVTAAAPAFASADMAGAHAFGCDMMAMDHAGHDMPQDPDTDAAHLQLCPLAASCMVGIKTALGPLRTAQAWVHATFDVALTPASVGKTYTLDPPPPRLG
ncbi:MAG: hypothetical protein AAFY01_09130 [Pseudomonadota bacterium]